VQKIGIVLADDHPIFRQALKTLLEREGFSIAAEACDGCEAIKVAEAFQPDVLVLDLSMPRLNGVGAAKEIHRVSPRTKVILVTVHREEQYVLEAIAAGVKAYVIKSEAAAMLPDAIREVCRGCAYFSPAVAQFAVDSMPIERANGNIAEPTHRRNRMNDAA
jgi:DNA-binding NarL/FixJ family response regulator